MKGDRWQDMAKTVRRGKKAVFWSAWSFERRGSNGSFCGFCMRFLDSCLCILLEELYVTLAYKCEYATALLYYLLHVVYDVLFLMTSCFAHPSVWPLFLGQPSRSASM